VPETAQARHGSQVTGSHDVNHKGACGSCCRPCDVHDTIVVYSYAHRVIRRSTECPKKQSTGTSMFLNEASLISPRGHEELSIM
jgi:hypothetical protein